MFPKQIQPTSYKQKTEPVLVRTGTPVIGAPEVRDSPKFEVEAGGKVEGSLTYGVTNFSGSIEASGKGKFGVRIRGRVKTTPEWWQDVTYQQSRKVMGQALGLAYPYIGVVAEGYIDWLEPDVIGPWVEVSRSREYRKDRIEFLVDSYELYDPPVVPQAGGLPLRLSTGKFISKVSSFDGEKMEFSVAGSPAELMTILNHSIQIDGVQSAPDNDITIGDGVMSAGPHTVTIEAYGDLGFFNFDIPILVVTPVEIEIPTAASVNFGESKVFKVGLRNNTSLVQMTTVNASALSSGWVVESPINPVAIPPNETVEVDIDVYSHPSNNSSMATDILVSAEPDQGIKVKHSFNVQNVISIQAVKQLEVEAVRQIHGLQNAMSFQIQPNVSTVTTTTGNTTTTLTTTNHAIPSLASSSKSRKILLNVCEWVTIRDERRAKNVRIKFNSRLDNDVKIEIKYDGRSTELEDPGDETVVYAKKVEVHAQGTAGSLAEIEFS
ncbi:MAG: hypothetical protein AAF901_09005 [Bacteroidota bacterium]